LKDKEKYFTNLDRINIYIQKNLHFKFKLSDLLDFFFFFII